jgi:hypothetical protein
LIAAVLAVTPDLYCAAQDDPLERLSLEYGSGADRWTAAEATATISHEHARLGDTSLLFHVDVDHTTGQPEYPIGWPRIHWKPPEELRDWSDWDFVQLVIHVETSRDSLPGKPLGFILHTPDRERQYNRQLTEVQPGETSTVTIPLSEIPDHENVTHIQFYISESEYKHGDVLDFFIDAIALLRYTKPTLSGVEVLQEVAFTTTRAIGVRFRLLGLAADEEAEVRGRLVDGETVLGSDTWTLGREQHEVWLAMDPRAARGDATLELALVGSREAVPVRIVPSPFESEGGE